jgi:hypothetical protein
VQEQFVSQYRQVSDLRMDSAVLEHKFKFQARLLEERKERLTPEMRSKDGGGARLEAKENAHKLLPRCALDTNKNQVQLLCEQALKRAGVQCVLCVH